MRIYLDTCCLMRFYDDSSQPRIRLETQAVGVVLKWIKTGKMFWVVGETLFFEVSVCQSDERRYTTTALLKEAHEIRVSTPTTDHLAKLYMKHGLNKADASHLAIAEIAGCDWLLTTDDLFLKRSKGIKPELSVRVANPVEFIKEYSPCPPNLFPRQL